MIKANFIEIIQSEFILNDLSIKYNHSFQIT